MANPDNQLLRLLHLASPSLPTGAFAYSQGLERAVADRWIQSGGDLQQWVADLITGTMAHVDIPILARMTAACRHSQARELARWCDLLLAMRETRELRLEEVQRGRAMVALLEGLLVPLFDGAKEQVIRSQLAGYALAVAHWQIDSAEAAAAYAWSWLENQVIAGIKIIPLGQTEGHRILLQLDQTVMAAVKKGLGLQDSAIGASNPALAIAGSRHETQYSRLYRS